MKKWIIILMSLLFVTISLQSYSQSSTTEYRYFTNESIKASTGLVASYTFANPIKGELIDEAGTNNGTVIGGISTREGMSFSDAYVDYGAIGNVKTITFRIDLESTTEKIFEGASNDLEVYANAGTLTYPDYDNAYIDGIDTDIITTGWHTITVISSTNVNLTAAKIGIINTTYGDFEIAENQFYSDEKGTTWIDVYHAKWEKVVKLIDFSFSPVGLSPVGFFKGTGIFLVAEEIVSEAHSKYLNCTSNGTTGFYIEDITDSTYVESLYYYNGSWADVGGYTIYRVANDNAWFSYSGNKVTFTLTSGQRIKDIIIKNQKPIQ